METQSQEKQSTPKVAPAVKTPHELEIEKLKEELLKRDQAFAELDKDNALALSKLAKAQKDLEDFKKHVTFVEKVSVKDRGDIMRVRRELSAALELASSRKVKIKELRRKAEDVRQERNEARKALAEHLKTATEAVEDHREGIDVKALSHSDIEDLRKKLTKRVKELNSNA